MVDSFFLRRLVFGSPFFGNSHIDLLRGSDPRLSKPLPKLNPTTGFRV